MPKATIKHNLNDPDDKMDFERLMQLGNLSSFVFQLTHNTKKTDNQRSRKFQT